MALFAKSSLLQNRCLMSVMAFLLLLFLICINLPALRTRSFQDLCANNIENGQHKPLATSIFHSSDVFELNYKEMEKKFKVYIYPDGDPNTFYQTPRKLTGKYASEGYFFQNIRESVFRTHDPEEADMFFIPISCHKMRGKRKIAMRVLSQDCSSGPCERNWSTWALFHTKKRNKLSTNQLERLVYCHCNLRLIEDKGNHIEPRQVNVDKIDIAKVKDIPEIPPDERDIYAMLYEEAMQPVRTTRSRSRVKVRVQALTTTSSRGRRASTSRGRRASTSAAPVIEEEEEEVEEERATPHSSDSDDDGDSSSSEARDSDPSDVEMDDAEEDA